MRELENILERAITLSADGEIQLRGHPAAIGQPARDAQRRPHAAGCCGVTGSGRQRRRGAGTQLEVIERDAIVQALEKTRYNKTAAAQLLGMSFRALRYRIKKLGIE